MRRRGYRGWVASTSAAVILSLTFLVVDKHLEEPTAPTALHVEEEIKEEEALDSLAQLSNAPPKEKAVDPAKGILLAVNPSLTETTESFPAMDQASIQRVESQASEERLFVQQPPEPVANVTLEAPIADSQLAELPLHSSGQDLNYLMESIDKAFEKPNAVVSSQRTIVNDSEPAKIGEPESSVLALPFHGAEVTPAEAAKQEIGLAEVAETEDAESTIAEPEVSEPKTPEPKTLMVAKPATAAPPAPVVLKAKMPQPESLLLSFDRLEQRIAGHDGENNRYVAEPSIATSSSLDATSRRMLTSWIAESRETLKRIVFEFGLENPQSQIEIEGLANTASQVARQAESMGDYELAADVIRISYSVQRRADVWLAVRSCLDSTSIALSSSARSPERTNESLLQVVGNVQQKLGDSAEGMAWRQFLMVDELSQWLQLPQSNLIENPQLISKVRERLLWPDLEPAQQAMLSGREFQDLAATLSLADRQNVDYRELLANIEEMEANPISRNMTEIAEAAYWLTVSSSDEHRFLAQMVSRHYRNANMRLSVTGEMLERFLPSGHHEIRPIRKRILGADTRGNSAVETEMHLQLIPDPAAWHFGLTVEGDMLSNTQASQGPAVFHSTSTAKINSSRYIRVARDGYSVSREPTDVSSRDYLRKMSTDYDSLPVIGDLIRAVVREQFDQKRGIARRISQRMIAQETDAELDRQLNSNLQAAEQQFEQRLLGPLQRLKLNPTVASMHTTEERLTVRYRVASNLQMASHTPRPRAPTGSLMSLQFHQSALNNAIAQLGLSGRTWNIAELYAHIGGFFGEETWTLPEDVPEDVTIRFADTRPATVEMIDGRLQLVLRIAELKQPSRKLHIQRCLVKTNYMTIAAGLEAELVKDGVVEILSQRRSDRLPLRLIFSKIFVSNPQIPLISRQWSEDERAQGLAVSQLDIRDGWLALAIGPADSPQAAAVALRAESIRNR